MALTLLVHHITRIKLKPIQQFSEGANGLRPFATRTLVIKQQDGERIKLLLFAETPEELALIGLEPVGTTPEPAPVVVLARALTDREKHDRGHLPFDGSCRVCVAGLRSAMKAAKKADDDDILF
jgi:hypothetical protein